MDFEWDETKNQINQKKHGVSFEEAATVFEDIRAILFDDPDHSETEERFLLIGIIKREFVSSVIVIADRMKKSGLYLQEKQLKQSKEPTRKEFRRPENERRI